MGNPPSEPQSPKVSQNNVFGKAQRPKKAVEALDAGGERWSR